MPVLPSIEDFLGSVTSVGWLDAARANLPDLLIDHANCEIKAAASAIGMVFRYSDKPELVFRMSRLAREELRHFEQVGKLLQTRNIKHSHLGAGRYAQGLRAQVRKDEPGRLVDLLIVGAFIEARSYERFLLLAPKLDCQIGNFYRRLACSEERHFHDYLRLAYSHDDGAAEQRIDAFRCIEAELTSRPDPEFRFHSGPPA